MIIAIAPGSMASRLHGTLHVQESFNCSYELNPQFETALESRGLRIAGRGEGGEARIVELPRNRFYIATLFQPQLSSKPGAPHPIIAAFVRAAMAKWRDG
jgi:CTP synthase (UTP-ammonia lyase)